MLYFYNILINTINYVGIEWIVSILYVIIAILLLINVRMAAIIHHSRKDLEKEIYQYVHDHRREHTDKNN